MNETTLSPVHALVAQLRRQGVGLRADGDNLRVTAPKGALDPTLLAGLREHKREIIALMTDASVPVVERAAVPSRRAPDQESYPLSPAQRRLYFLQALEPRSVAYNIVDVYRIDGDVDATRLERALGAVIDRHEVLRTGFAIEDGQPVQRISDDAGFALERGRDPHFDPGRLGDFVRPFDLSRPPLLRARLVTVEPGLHHLLIDIHHMVFDGGSRAVFAEDFAEAWHGGRLTPTPLAYKDYASWLKSSMDGPELSGAAEYWKREFATPPPVLELTGARPRPSRLDFAGDRVRFEIDADLMTALRQFCLRRNLTLFMVLLAAYKVLLHRHSGQREFVVGFPVDMRTDHGRDSLRGMIGMFVNTVPVRTGFDERTTFEAHVNLVRDKVLAGLDAARYPFEALVEQVGIRRELSRNPLFDAFFALDTARDTATSRWEDLGWREQGFDTRSAQFDLTLNVLDTGTSAHAELEYATTLLDHTAVESMADDYQRVLAAVVADPLRSIGGLAPAPPSRATARPTESGVSADSTPPPSVASGPPATDTERALAAIWSDVLGTGDIGRDADFFELGGHSLSAVEVMYQINDALSVMIELSVLFEATVLVDLAGRVDQLRRAES